MTWSSLKVNRRLFLDHGLRDKDLSLSVVQSNVKSILNCNTISSVKDVANSLTITERLVGNVALLLTFRLISKSNKELASSKSQESVVSVCFSILVIPDLGILSCSVDFSNLLVKSRLSIEVSPERLSVLRVVTSSEVLLRSVVNEWNTSCCHRENNGRSKSSVISWQDYLLSQRKQWQK